MEFLKTAKQRSIVSEIIYIGLNLALAIGILLAVRAFESPIIALLLVFLSKWRVLAVRPRYWLVNIQSNFIDLIVSVSFVGLLFFNTSTAAQIVMTILYIAWLFFLKPQSKRGYVVAQSHVAMLVGIIALFNVSYTWPSFLVVAFMWFIGYACARHSLGVYSDSQNTFLSLVWGLILAQLGWLAYHWSIAYVLVSAGGLKIAQVAIIATLLTFLVERVYSSFDKNGKVHAADIILPASLAISVIIILEFMFNSIGTGAI